MKLRSGSPGYLLLRHACAQEMTVAELIDRLAERLGVLLDYENARRVVYDLAQCGYLRRTNPQVTAPHPARYVLTGLGEVELERLWAKAVA
ncbi:hypothetical protein [Deinococcus petrolearius]|uniref:Transcription regulator PadR N-terminal domain-containing protein n=1 Tax=Deinococcus petrolearius TaxID=1751295 RepID=A0ABW1DEK9_9DEIO